MQKFWQISLLLSLMFFGCDDETTVQQSENGDPLLKSIVIKAPINEPDKDALYQLAESAKSVTASLNKLAKVQRAQNPKFYREKTNIVKKRIKGTVSVDYIGPIEPLLKKLAKSTKMRYRKIGKSTGTPIIVSLKVANSSLKEAIEDISYQAQNHASVQVTRSGVIQIRYLKM